MSEKTATEAAIEEASQNTREKDKLPEGDFKVAEIWVKGGQIFIEALEGFWDDRCRAIGLLEYCKDIVKNAQMKAEKSKIITPN